MLGCVSNLTLGGALVLFLIHSQLMPAAAATCPPNGQCYAISRMTLQFPLTGCGITAFPWNSSTPCYVYAFPGSGYTSGELEAVVNSARATWWWYNDNIVNIVTNTDNALSDSHVRLLSSTQYAREHPSNPDAVGETRAYSEPDGSLIAANTDLNGIKAFTDGAVSGAFDLQGELVHEIGHWLGLADVESPAGCGPTGWDMASMWYDQEPGSIAARSLSSGDITGLEVVMTHTDAIVPGSFVATGGEAQIELSWVENDPGATGSYGITRSRSCDGPYQLVAWVALGDPSHTNDSVHYSFIDSSMQCSGHYYYRVLDTEQRPHVADASVYGLGGSIAPGEVFGLTAEPGSAGNGVESVRLTWRPANNATAYHVFVGMLGTTPCSGALLYRGSVTDTSYSDMAPTLGEPLEYRVQAEGTCARGEISDAVQAIVFANVEVSDSVVTMCPAGDGEWIRMSLQLHPDAPITLGDAVEWYAMQQSGVAAPKVFLDDDSYVAPGGHIAPIAISLSGRSVSFEIRKVSGCGVIVFDLYAGSVRIGENLRFNVRSFDQDGHSVGAVDRFDLSALSAAVIQGTTGCWDLDWSGGAVNPGDMVPLEPHFSGRHHVPRRLMTPSGGETYGPGDVVPITWQAGLGDSARVTLRVVHAAYDTSLIVSDTLDTGSYNWLVPPTNKAGTSARVEVLHSAGYYKVDYADVGMDASDTTLTFYATPVADLQAVTGKNTAVLTWSDPMQGSPVADEHEIWYRHSSPLTDQEFTSGSTRLTCAPGAFGTSHCVEINSLTQCKTYYFAMRTMDRGVWSKLSNVAVSQTACSGFEVVFCEESGLMAGGGEGEGELAQATRLASAGNPLLATGAEMLAENSLLCGSRGDMVEDLFRLSTGDALSRGVSEVVLRESALREAEVDAVGLGMVAHPSGTEAVPGGGMIWVGATHPIGRARAAAGADVAAALAAGGEAGIGFRGGDVVTIEPGGDAAGAALVLESRNRVFAARDDSSGILIQRPDRSGVWSTVARIQPRREFDRQAIPTEGASTLRLVFLKEYSVRAIERLDGITAATPRALSLADASHSRLGSVDGAVDRSGGEKTTLAMGDTLVLRFTPLEPEAGMEHSYFLSIRGAVETAAEDTRLQAAASLVAAAGPAISNSLGAARPNPTAGGAVIAFTLAAPGQTELSIYDVSGRRMRTVQSAELPMGAHEVQWDGRDAGGRVVAAGVYFYRLQAGPWRSERKLIVLQK